MFGSWKLGTIRGIGVHIHWTFWLLMIFFTLSAMAADGVGAGLFTALFVGLVFVCVVAHEFGHAFAAAAYGIPTHDITLLPIGGVARLARMPQNPWQELAIAVAGPAVNVVIAAVLFLLQAVVPLPAISENAWMLMGGSLIENLIAANVFLVLFNMLPAFPMDGGRVLRSLIAMRTSHLRATEIAARIGRWMALAFVLVGLVYGPIGLLLVGLFVFLSGTGELLEARRRAMAANGSPWFQWRWSSAPTFTQPEQPGRAQTSVRGDVIDALEVREIKRAPFTGF
jgi:Zn-dependent protease